MNTAPRKHPAHIRYLVEEILRTCRDSQSSRFYALVARDLPDSRIFQFLAEIRQDPSIRNRGAVFTAKVKRYLAERQRKCQLALDPPRTHFLFGLLYPIATIIFAY